MSNSENTSQDPLVGWRKPSAGFYKLNVDAAFFSAHKAAQLGMVVRDSLGEVLWSAVKKVVQVSSPLQAELLAILFGLEEIAGRSFQDIEVESDSLLAIREVDNNNHSFCEWEGISLDIRKCALLFQTCRFRHIRRGSNSLAHDIASLTNVSGDYMYWRQSLPNAICNPDMD